MSFQEIYNVLPVWAQNQIVSTYGYVQFKRRYSGDYPRIREQVDESLRLTSDEICRWQEARLRSVLALACTRIPYYRHRQRAIGVACDESSLASWPLLTKADVRLNALALRDPTNKPFWINSTSGSTGTPLEVALDRYTYRLSMALLAAHEAAYGIHPGAARATFAGRLIQPVANERLPLWRYNRADNQMLFSTVHISDRSMPAYLNELGRFQPDEVIGYPSAIYAVAEYCRRTGTTPAFQPKAVVTNSETLFDWQRDLIGEVFRCPVADYYGTAECVVFAGQCAEGRYHFNPLLSIVEVLDDSGAAVAPGHQGHLVCSTLTNTVMPLIRYQVGDDAVLALDPCPCGSSHPSVFRIVGRTDDNVVTPEGRTVGRLDHIFKGVRGVRECQIVQDAPDHLVLLVVADATFDEQAGRDLIDNLRVRVGDSIKVEIQAVHSIPRTSSGKFKGVVSKIPPSPSPTGSQASTSRS